jgi:hypothetical protein
VGDLAVSVLATHLNATVVDVRYGSEAEVQTLRSLAAASECKAAIQTRNFNFPELTSAYESEADY